MAQEILTNFDLRAALPLDIRMQVPDINARDSINPLVRWEGMIVYVVTDQNHYRLVGGTDNANWEIFFAVFDPANYYTKAEVDQLFTDFPAVKYDTNSQGLDSTQRQNARTNIQAVGLEGTETIAGTKTWSGNQFFGDDVGLNVGLGQFSINDNVDPNYILLNGVNGRITHADAVDPNQSTTLGQVQDMIDGIVTEVNLDYTSSPIDGTVTNDQGTNAVIPAATGTNAGLLLPAEKTKLAGLESSHFKGQFPDLASLQAAFPTANPGDYADVDEGVGEAVVRYVWDDSDGEWTPQSGESTQLTAAQVKQLYESNPDTNAFTDTDVSLVASALQPGDNVSELINDAGYALDADVVHITGAETITGIKTFNQGIEIASAATPNDPVLLSWDESTLTWTLGDAQGVVNFDFSALTVNQTYLWPDKSGTVALLDDVPNVSGTTNVLPKFDTSGLIDSQVFDDGTNVGIGTDTPLGKLHVLHDTANDGLTIQRIAAVQGRYSLAIAGTGHNSFRISDEAQNAVRMLIDGDGNIGIGTTSPGEKLQIQGNTRGVGRGVFGDGAVLNVLQLIGGGVGTANASYLSYYDNTETRQGYIGFSSPSNDNLVIANEVTGKSLQLGGNGNLVYNGRIQTEGGNMSGNLVFDLPTSNTVATGTDRAAIWKYEDVNVSGILLTIDDSDGVRAALLRGYVATSGYQLSLNVGGIEVPGGNSDQWNNAFSLASSALQPGDNVSELTNDAGYGIIGLASSQVRDNADAEAWVNINSDLMSTRFTGPRDTLMYGGGFQSLENISLGSFVTHISVNATDRPFTNTGGLISFGSSDANNTVRLLGANDGSDNLWFSSGVATNPYFQIASRDYVDSVAVTKSQGTTSAIPNSSSIDIDIPAAITQGSWLVSFIESDGSGEYGTIVLTKNGTGQSVVAVLDSSSGLTFSASSGSNSVNIANSSGGSVTLDYAYIRMN